MRVNKTLKLSDMGNPGLYYQSKSTTPDTSSFYFQRLCHKWFLTKRSLKNNRVMAVKNKYRHYPYYVCRNPFILKKLIQDTQTEYTIKGC